MNANAPTREVIEKAVSEAIQKLRKQSASFADDSRRDGFASGDEAARFLGLSPAMITKLVAAGEIPHRRYGRSLRIPWSWLLNQAEVGKSA